MAHKLFTINRLLGSITELVHSNIEICFRTLRLHTNARHKISHVPKSQIPRIIPFLIVVGYLSLYQPLSTCPLNFSSPPTHITDISDLPFHRRNANSSQHYDTVPASHTASSVSLSLYPQPVTSSVEAHHPPIEHAHVPADPTSRTQQVRHGLEA